MEHKLKIGLIGYGKLGTIHAKNIAGSGKAILYAVCDINADALERAKNDHGAETFTKIDDFLNMPLDGVVISTSTSQHLENIIKIAKKNIPIFTEKPIGLTLQKTDEVLMVLSEAKIPLQIGFQRRWDPRYVELKRVIDSGEIGNPVLMKAFGRDTDASNPSNWGLEKNGGLFLNAAIHDYDLARYLFGQDIIKLSASGDAVVHKDLKNVFDVDTCSTTLFLKDGSIAMTEWSRYAAYGYDAEVEVVCTEGAIRIGKEYMSPLTVIHKNQMAPTVYEVFADAFKAEIEGFIKSIAEKIPMSPGIEDARIALQIALLARSSYENNSHLISVPTLKPITS